MTQILVMKNEPGSDVIIPVDWHSGKDRLPHTDPHIVNLN
jgi:hypothetical protein